VLADEARKWQEDTCLPSRCIDRHSPTTDGALLLLRAAPTASDPGVRCLCRDPVVGQPTAWETRSRELEHDLRLEVLPTSPFCARVAVGQTSVTVWPRRASRTRTCASRTFRLPSWVGSDRRWR
jgi:hypothetical protein